MNYEKIEITIICQGITELAGMSGMVTLREVYTCPIPGRISFSRIFCSCRIGIMLVVFTRT